MFILDTVINPLNQNPQLSGQNTAQGQNQPAQNQPGQNTEQQRQEALRLQQELNDRVRILGDRVRGTEYNIRTGEEELPGRFNIFAGMSGARAAMQRSIEADRRLLGRLQGERNTQVELQNRISRLMQEGKHEEATAIMQGREQEYRQRILNAGRQAIQETQAANRGLQQADQFLGNVETGLRVAQRATVVAGAVVATAATGGAGAPLLVTALAGTAAGTGVGALTNFTEATGHGVLGNKSWGEAMSDAVSQTGQDALTSAQIGISGGVGASVGKVVIGRAASGVAPSLVRQVAAGVIGGGSSGLTSETLRTGTNIAMGNEQRSAGQIVADFGRSTLVGTLSGGVGARGQAAINNGASGLRAFAIRAGGDVALPSAISLGSSYGSSALFGTQAPTLDQAVQEVGMAILGSKVGANAARNHQNGTYGSNWRQNLTTELTTTPTFNLASRSIGRLFARQNPPTPRTQNPQRVDVPDSVRQQQNYRSANQRGGLDIVVDETLPPGTRAQTEVVEQNGVRTARIRISRDVAEGLGPDYKRAFSEMNPFDRVELKRLMEQARFEEVDVFLKQQDLHGVRILSEEIDHANQPIINPRQNGRVMSETEYNARRAFQEITAESSSSSRLGGPRHGGTLRQMRQMMDAGDFEGALAIARENFLSESDISNFRSDYEHNTNPNRTGLRQTSNSTATIEELTQSAKTLDDLQLARQFAEEEGVNAEQFNELARRRINQWIEESKFHNFDRLIKGRHFAEQSGINGDRFSNSVKDRARQLATQSLENGGLTPQEEATLKNLGLENWLSKAKARVRNSKTEPGLEGISSRALRLLEKARTNPANITESEMVNLMESFGFDARKGTKGHYVFHHPALGNETVGAASPHPQVHVKEPYIKNCLDAIDRVLGKS